MEALHFRDDPKMLRAYSCSSCLPILRAIINPSNAAGRGTPWPWPLKLCSTVYVHRIMAGETDGQKLVNEESATDQIGGALPQLKVKPMPLG